MSSSPLTVVAVSNDALRPELLDMLLTDGGYTALVVESIARSYSRIAEVHAGLVVLFMEADDEDACRLLFNAPSYRAAQNSVNRFDQFC